MKSLISQVAAVIHYFSEYSCSWKRTILIDCPLLTAWTALYGHFIGIPARSILVAIGIGEVNEFIGAMSGIVLLALGLLRVRNEWKRGKQIDKEDG